MPDLFGELGILIPFDSSLICSKIRPQGRKNRLASALLSSGCIVAPVLQGFWRRTLGPRGALLSCSNASVKRVSVPPIFSVAKPLISLDSAGFDAGADALRPAGFHFVSEQDRLRGSG